jgi:hypothetical protein
MALRVLAPLALAVLASAQTYQRLGTCPTLGCILPPDQADFYPGQTFDLRIEVHAPINGSEAYASGKPDEAFSVTVQKKGAQSKGVAQYFGRSEPSLEKWTFSYFEDLFAQDAGVSV